MIRDEDIAQTETAARTSPGLLRRVCTAPIRLYQHAAENRPSPCRFTPSCSTYALEAIEAHGPIRGLYLAMRRIVRCHPWGGQGYDPVPAAHGGHSHPHSRNQKVH